MQARISVRPIRDFDELAKISGRSALHPAMAFLKVATEACTFEADCLSAFVNMSAKGTRSPSSHCRNPISIGWGAAANR